MPRPIMTRRIFHKSEITYFKPTGVPLRNLEEVLLNNEEIEALRLKDVEGMGQSECAKKMGVSQPTFFRIIRSARKKSSDAIVNGKAIRIDGGNFAFHGKGFGKRKGRKFKEE
jgi:predicted DNA-binding protein (UPF0251 family)